MKVFDNEWVKTSNQKLLDTEVLEIIVKSIPTLEQLLAYDINHQGGRTAAHYQIWAQKLYNEAIVGDYSNGLAEQVWSKLPRLLRELVEPVLSWDKLRDRINKVNMARLQE